MHTGKILKKCEMEKNKQKGSKLGQIKNSVESVCLMEYNKRNLLDTWEKMV